MWGPHICKMMSVYALLWIAFGVSYLIVCPQLHHAFIYYMLLLVRCFHCCMSLLVQYMPSLVTSLYSFYASMFSCLYLVSDFTCSMFYMLLDRCLYFVWCFHLFVSLAPISLYYVLWIFLRGIIRLLIFLHYVVRYIVDGCSIIIYVFGIGLHAPTVL